MNAHCPACQFDVHLRDMGIVLVDSKPRHVLVCSKCDAWIEEIRVLRTLPKATESHIRAGHK